MLSKHRELQLSTKNAPSEKELQGGFSGIVTESNELQIEKQKRGWYSEASSKPQP
jgi:hypothetical protein